MYIEKQSSRNVKRKYVNLRVWKKMDKREKRESACVRVGVYINDR